MSDIKTIKAPGTLLIDAYEAGRPIIPFLGAGISVNSGFPSMAAITEYLAKVRFYVRYIAKTVQRSEAEYLRNHGWPDISQLNAEVWRHLHFPASLDDVMAPFVAKIPTMNESGKPMMAEEDVKETFRIASRWDENRNGRIRLAVQSQFWDALSDHESRAAKDLWPGILGETELRGDWYDLMMSLTEGDFDLVDSLFLGLGHGRRPASDHIFLAQLADTFRVRLYLSLNFDTLLETALWNEGHNPNVIEVAKDADLPAHETIRDRLTILKLHGGAYGVRIGERIQVSADQNTQSRARHLIPENALILVMGFSGHERRMTQILTEHCRRHSGNTQLLWMNFGKTEDKPLKKILGEFRGPRWLPGAHSVGKLPAEQSSDTPIAVRSYDGVSQLLFGVLVQARGQHPAGLQSYPTLPTRPGTASQKSGGEAPSSSPLPRPAIMPQQSHAEKPIIAFFRDKDWGLEMAANHSNASVAMAEFCVGKARTHHTIWIDCEQHHTVDGVVAEILDTVYQYDPAFRPLLMQSVGNRDFDYDRPIERIREALQRGRYILAFDSPETIGRPQTVHHGTPSLTLPIDDLHSESFKNRVRDFNDRVEGFFQFLTKLLIQEGTEQDQPPPAADIGASFLCVALAPPSSRRPDNDNSQTLLHVREQVGRFRKAIWKVRRFVNVRSVRHQPNGADPPRIDFARLVDTLFDPSVKLDSTEIYAILTFFRRPRSYLAYHALRRVPSVWIDESQVMRAPAEAWDELFGVAKTAENRSSDPLRGAFQLAGGLLWLPRWKHNRDYERVTEPGQKAARALLYPPRQIPDKDIREAILSLLTTAILHRRAARYYFSEVYEATGDIAAFREYIYHRVSYLRTLCRFLGVAKLGDRIRAEDDSGGAALERDTRNLVAWSIGHYGYPDENPWQKSPRESHISTSWNEIRTEVRRAWREELGAFRATLSREFDAVLSKLYAGTWISLTDRLLEIDFHEMFDESFFTISEPSDPEVELCKQERRFLAEELRIQQLKARFEMADWKGLLNDTQMRRAEEVLAGSATPLLEDIKAFLSRSATEESRTKNAAEERALIVSLKKALSAGGKSTPAGFVEGFMDLLELSGEWLLRAEIYHELTCPEENDDGASRLQQRYVTKAERLSRRLAKWLEIVDRERGTADPNKPRFSKEIRNLLHDRLTQHRLEVLGAIARFGFNRVNALDPEQRPVNLSKVRDDAIGLYEQSRRTVFQDGLTYNHFRAKSLRMVARCDYLKTKDPRRFSKPIADINLALRLLDRHAAADTLEFLSCYRTKAEAYMLWAKELIGRGCYDAARSRLSSARSTIDRAAQAFDRRRRNVPWWLRLCHLRAQWAAFSCGLRVKEWNRSDNRNPAFESDLRYGLDAIRAGLDGLLPVRTKTVVKNDEDEARPIDEAEKKRREENDYLIRNSTRWQWSHFVCLWMELADATKEMIKKTGKEEEFAARWELANREARLPELWKSWNDTKGKFVASVFKNFIGGYDGDTGHSPVQGTTDSEGLTTR